MKSKSSGGTEEGEAGLAHGALDAGLGSVGDLLCHQEGEVVAVAHLLGLGLLLEFGDVLGPDESSEKGLVKCREEGGMAYRMPLCSTMPVGPTTTSKRRP